MKNLLKKLAETFGGMGSCEPPQQPTLQAPVAKRQFIFFAETLELAGYHRAAIVQGMQAAIAVLESKGWNR